MATLYRRNYRIPRTIVILAMGFAVGYLCFGPELARVIARNRIVIENFSSALGGEMTKRVSAEAKVRELEGKIAQMEQDAVVRALAPSEDSAPTPPPQTLEQAYGQGYFSLHPASREEEDEYDIIEEVRRGTDLICAVVRPYGFPEASLRLLDLRDPDRICPPISPVRYPLRPWSDYEPVASGRTRGEVWLVHKKVTTGKLVLTSYCF